MSAEAAKPQELLDIHQAADYLQVSEISLRRWTDAGRLHCFRIGGRRERRFRREDLERFLENYRPASIDKGVAASATPADCNLQGMDIPYGSHLCSLYESESGRLKLAVPFLNEGLKKGDICFLVASEPVASTIMGALDKTGTDKALVAERLRVCHGKSSVAAIYDYFETEFFQLTQAGQTGLRVLGDMAWFLDKGHSLEELVEFESRYNHYLAHHYPVISLCQFDARRFDGSGILHALNCHHDTFQYPLSRFIGV